MMLEDRNLPNIFLTLARYAFRQDENFLTESLVYLLQVILEREPEICKTLLGNICGSQAAVLLRRPDVHISLGTQFSVEEGRPDIVVQLDPGMIVFIEVKQEARLSQNQLEVYFQHLERITDRKTGLVLLTRSRHAACDTTLDTSRFHHVCWYEIAGWLSETAFKDPVLDYLSAEFIEFLKAKELSMEKVSWEYIRGVPAMRNLYDMIGTALAEAAPEKSVRRTVGMNWSGYFVDDIFTGFRYSNPLLIVFENQGGSNPDFNRKLRLEDAHFFSLSAGEQLECLIEFLREGFSEYEVHGGSAMGL